MSPPHSAHLPPRRETYISPPLSLAQAAQIHAILQQLRSSHDVPPETRRGSWQSASSLAVASATATAPQHSPAATSEARVSPVAGSDSPATTSSPATVTQDEEPPIADAHSAPPAAAQTSSSPSPPAAKASSPAHPISASLAATAPSRRGRETLPGASPASARRLFGLTIPPFGVSSVAATPDASPATETDCGTRKEARDGRGRVLRRFFLSRWVARRKREVEAEMRAGRQKERPVEGEAEEEAEVGMGVDVDGARRMKKGRAGLPTRVAAGIGA